MKENILLTIDDLVRDFLYYDRKEDEDLQVGDIQNALIGGEITLDEIAERFKETLEKHLE